MFFESVNMIRLLGGCRCSILTGEKWESKTATCREFEQRDAFCCLFVLISTMNQIRLC